MINYVKFIEFSKKERIQYNFIRYNNFLITYFAFENLNRNEEETWRKALYD